MNRYFIIFKSSKSWWQRFFRKGFGHCFIIRQIDDNTHVQLEPIYHHLDIRLLALTEQELLKSFWHADYTILSIDIDFPQDFNSIFGIIGLKLFNCVTIVKYILGIRNIFVITPFQLYKYLERLNMGGGSVDTSGYEAAQQKQLEELKTKEDEERKKAEQERIAMTRSRVGGAGGNIPTKQPSSLLGG